MMNRKMRACFLGLTGLAISGAFAVPALGYSTRMHYSACMDDLSGSSFKVGGNDSTTGILTLTCPVPSNTDLDHASMTKVHLYYEDNHTSQNVSAARCIAYQNIAGGVCGDWVSSSSTGTSFLTLPNSPPSFAANWNWGHFPSVGVLLPVRSGTSSKVKGYWMSN
jgi:hypothetical protein